MKHFLVSLLGWFLFALYVGVHVYFLIHVKTEGQANLLLFVVIIEGFMIESGSWILEDFLDWLEYEM